MVVGQIHIASEEVARLLSTVPDPEIPVLSVLDLGVVRRVDIDGKNIDIDLTPTYSGCPAMDTMAVDITSVLLAEGYLPKVNLVLSPAWSTDWISENGRKKLAEYGVAPPLGNELDKRALLNGERLVTCTNCQSTNTTIVSQFGSTACKALFKCEDCLEPFDYFKCLK